MPYTKKTLKNGKIAVYKKEGGKLKKVGETTPGKYKAYMAALHIHEKKR